jgi:hypothetical protein
VAARHLSQAFFPAAVNRINAIGQKFRATVKMNVASREPGLSQYVVRSTFLYLKSDQRAAPDVKVLPKALVGQVLFMHETRLQARN